jgi:hypothetical protein
MMDIPVWLGSDEHKEQLAKEDARFLFEQAEKLLKDTVDTSNIIAARTNTLITIITGSLIATIGYLIAGHKNQVFNNIMYVAVIGAVYLFVLAILAFENINHKAYLIPGSLPEDLFNEAFFDPKIPNEQRIIYFYVNEFENYQFRIKTNRYINLSRWKRYDEIVMALFILPVILAIVYIFT